MFAPSAALNEDDHVEPLSMEYSTTAPVSAPVTARAPSLVMRSPGVPVSRASDTDGAAAAVSSVKLKLVAADLLPATST